MRVNTRLFIIMAASLLALLSIATVALLSTRATLGQEKREQITHLLRMAEGTMSHFQKLEEKGRARGGPETGHRRPQCAQGGRYHFFGRNPQNVVMFHPSKDRVGSGHGQHAAGRPHHGGGV